MLINISQVMHQGCQVSLAHYTQYPDKVALLLRHRQSLSEPRNGQCLLHSAKRGRQILHLHLLVHVNFISHISYLHMPARPAISISISIPRSCHSWRASVVSILLGNSCKLKLSIIKKKWQHHFRLRPGLNMVLAHLSCFYDTLQDGKQLASRGIKVMTTLLLQHLSFGRYVAALSLPSRRC